MSSPKDEVHHPGHYNAGQVTHKECGKPIECIDVARHFNFAVGNAIKYLWRAGLKGDKLMDLKKAAWYIADEISHTPTPRAVAAVTSRGDVGTYWSWGTAGVVEEVVRIVERCFDGSLVLEVARSPRQGVKGDRFSVTRATFNEYAVRQLDDYADYKGKAPSPAGEEKWMPPLLGSRWKILTRKAFVGPSPKEGGVRLYEDKFGSPDTWSYSLQQFWDAVEKGTISNDVG